MSVPQEVPCVTIDSPYNVDSRKMSAFSLLRQAREHWGRLRSGSLLTMEGSVLTLGHGGTLIDPADLDEADEPWFWTNDHAGRFDAIATPPEPAPSPAVSPGPPTEGTATATQDLFLRKKPATDGEAIGVMPIGSPVTLTGRVAGDWREVTFTGAMKGAPAAGTFTGWAHGGWLAASVNDAKFDAAFPPFTHQCRWFFTGSVIDDPQKVRDTIDAILQDPRSWQRAGVQLLRVDDPRDAHLQIGVTANPCGGAPACWVNNVIEVGADNWGSDILFRRVNHEPGHQWAMWDQYPGSQYARPIHSIMGAMHDDMGDHYWPDDDDVRALGRFKEGRVLVVRPR